MKFGSSGSNSLVQSDCSNVEPSCISSYTVSVWSPFVTIVSLPRTRTGAYIIRLGSVSFDGSKACVRIPSPSVTNTLFLLFSLLPMIKYAIAACFPSAVFPTTMPLPGYVFEASSLFKDTFSIKTSVFSVMYSRNLLNEKFEMNFFTIVTS